jgi:uncharacterized protein YbjT (DUF2867 family)
LTDVKVIVFGATGMLGQGVLRECLLAPDVDGVLVVGRKATGKQHEKLREVIRQDLSDLSDMASELSGYDACFFCLGVSSVGMSEADYRRITHDLTLGAAKILAAHNPAMTFIYISGAGTDTNGRQMWARVKGQTEDELLAMPFQAHMFRPGYIQPMHGETSSVRLYAVLLAVLKVFYPVLRRVFPRQVTTTEAIGKAMLTIARSGTSKRVLGSPEINELA